MVVIGGRVENGLIIPDAPLPEGTRVEITVAPSEDERDEWAAWDAASAQALETVEAIAQRAALKASR